MGVLIRTDRLELRSLDEDGARAVLRGRPPDGVLWAEGYPLPSTLEAAALVIGAEPRARWLDPFVSFQILRRDQPCVIGDCGFGSPPDSDGAVDIRWQLVERLHGRGFEGEALEADPVRLHPRRGRVRAGDGARGRLRRPPGARARGDDGGRRGRRARLLRGVTHNAARSCVTGG